MKNKVYVLFQTDIWKTKSSRVCFGVFLYENAAIDAAKENGLYTNESEVDIIVEKPLNFDPFGHAELSLFAKI